MKYWAIALCIAAVFSTTRVIAAPCTDDDWQPTFVHDLDNEEGPYYVDSGGNFVKLNWVQNGGYYPHACQLVKGPQDVRDRRGFTTCQEYTRIQCGCTRTIVGNRTCAAFLNWHPARSASVPVPGSRPPTPTSIPMIPAHWQRAPQYSGPVTVSSAGLVLQGGAWTNGRLQNGVYDGNRIYSNDVFVFSNGGDAYLRFMANGGGKYMGIWPRVIEGVSVQHMTTEHSWANSVVIPENTWIYAHLHVEPDGGYRIAVALSNYDDNGGRVIYQNTGKFTYPRGRFELQFADNYAGTAASVTIGDARVAASESAPVATLPPPPASPAPPAPSSPPAARPTGGGACSSDTDCPNSVCLLGVCARPSAPTPRRF